jgi:hypothetical protein
MPFESLSFRCSIIINEFPYRWLPLIYLYDPDLPLFPIYYFHVLPDNLPPNHRPTQHERAFGYVEKINLAGNNLEVTIITNKNIDDPHNSAYLNPVKNEVFERFGIVNAVTLADINDAFTGNLAHANNVLIEMWHRVVANAYGNKLPFGRLWDEVLGLTRFAASWYSTSGRKGELIETHYFATKFGEALQSAGGIPSVDFYLLPTIHELTDSNNPLTIFPNYEKLKEIARLINVNYCEPVNVSGLTLSKFKNPFGGSLNTEKLLNIFQSANIPNNLRSHAFECFNSFGKGPARTILFLLLLHDVASCRLSPSMLTSAQCGSIYEAIKGTYQSPKVIEIYAQQSFGNESAMPLDTWVESVLRYPLVVWPVDRQRRPVEGIFQNSNALGKVERLFWVTVSAGVEMI